MAIRLTGLASGMDTESMVQELMKVQRLKSTKIENKLTKLDWTQDKWKALNTKLYSFYTGSLSKLRFQGNFSTKKSTSSNENVVEVKANTTAPEGTHTIKVKSMASAQFLTGDKLGTDKNGKVITNDTKLADLGFLASEGTVIKIETGKKVVNLDIGSSTTIRDFTSALKDAGLNASYDTVQKRFFISSKESGVDNAFSITTSSSEYAQERNIIRDYLNYGTLSSTNKVVVDNALEAYISSTSTTEDKETAKDSLLDIKHNQVKSNLRQAYITNQTNIDETTISVRASLEAELSEGETLDEDVLNAAVKAKLAEDAELEVAKEFDAWQTGTALETNAFLVADTELNTLLINYETNNSTEITQSNNLSLLGLSEIVKTTVDGKVNVSAGSNVSLVQAADAVIYYNGAELTSSSNTIEANGLSILVKGVTAGMDTVDPLDDETITLNISNDTQAVYDMIKGFVQSYNELLKEINTSYYAESARGYEPLTADEKKAMSESQIEKWEDRIKNSLLRRDSTLSSLKGIFSTNLSRSVRFNEKSYSLASFGITTVNYTEKGILHIKGDADDFLVSGDENLLMKALADNPEAVMSTLSDVAGKLYESLTTKMKSSSLSSALTIYNDKQLNNTKKDYQDSLKKLEARLMDMESRYYKQFSAMEKAMANMNSQSSYIASMFNSNMSKY